MNRNRISGVNVSMLSLNGIDRGFETIKLVFVASLLKTQHSLVTTSIKLQSNLL
jgi:hypothetical protein